MIISDLSYLEIVREENVEGGTYSFYFSDYFSVYKNIYSNANVSGNVATANADAHGYDTLTQTFTYVDPYNSSSLSISATR